MRKLKIYLDTSIVGCLYQETQLKKMTETLKLWEQIDIVTPTFLLQEGDD